MDFMSRLDKALLEHDIGLLEGVVIRVNTVVANAISVPEGEYRVLLKDADSCTLISTNEASKQQFDVLRPTLAGFFNPEVHMKTISINNGKTIAENK